MMGPETNLLAFSLPKLLFMGEWRWWLAALGGLALGCLAFWLYRRDLRGRTGALTLGLPLLRAGAVFLLVLMLAEPVLQWRRQQGDFATVQIYIDASASMNATDEQMAPSRKLNLVQKLGWAKGGKAAEDGARAALNELTSLRSRLAGLKGGAKTDLATLVEEGNQRMKRAAEALAKVDSQAWSAERQSELDADLATPLGLVDPKVSDAKTQLLDLLPEAEKWEAELRKVVAAQDTALTATLNGDTRKALERFDTTPRWERLKHLLLGGDESVLERLAMDHHVEVYLLAGRKAVRIWRRERGPEAGPLTPPREFLYGATNQMTDLFNGVSAGVKVANPPPPGSTGARLNAVLITDGQYNEGPSPLESVGLFPGVGFYTVGIGAVQPAMDIAVMNVDSPMQPVDRDANVKWKVFLYDGMPAGKPFRIRLENREQVVWTSRVLNTQDHPTRREQEFTFNIKDLVERELRLLNRDLAYSNLPLNLDVIVSEVEGETNLDNNRGILRINVATQKPRVLYLAGRPRWEYRFLRNILLRNERWEVDVVLAGTGGPNQPFRRGPGPDMFPASLAQLYSYQLIIFGDVAPGMFRRQELEWIRNFVMYNGGGLIFIDGNREMLSSYTRTVLAPLFPARFAAAGPHVRSMKLTWQFNPTAAGREHLRLGDSDAEAARIWSGLPAPRLLRRVVPAHPAVDVLLYAHLRQPPNDQRFPALLHHRAGAGSVLYAGFDESWRFRYRVGDLHHERYWNQICKWIMEEPYAVQDRYLALDSGNPVYHLGDTANIRLRVRDPRILPNPNVMPEIQLYRDGKPFGRVPLERDPNSFIFRGATSPLDTPGEYEVRVRIPGLPEDQVKVSTQFTVSSNPYGEQALVQCDEVLLRDLGRRSALANAAGKPLTDDSRRYYPEEDLAQLADDLKPQSTGKIITTEVAVWQSYWWFVPVIMLLAVEWFWRKHAGLV